MMIIELCLPLGNQIQTDPATGQPSSHSRGYTWSGPKERHMNFQKTDNLIELPALLDMRLPQVFVCAGFTTLALPVHDLA